MKNIIKTVLLFAVMVGYGQTTTKNYVKETTRRTASVGEFPVIGGTNTHVVTTTYYDGLGRPVQMVDQNSSPEDSKNIVTHIEYEKNIGQTKEYLPFLSTGYTTTSSGGSFPIVTTTYKSDFVDNAKDQTFSLYETYNNDYTFNPYSEVRKEASPRQRVLETGFPGSDWAISDIGFLNPPIEDLRNSIRSLYSLNTASEVKRYTVSTTFSDGVYKNSITANGSYPLNTLTKTVIKDENWKAGDGSNNTVEEFKDVRGNVMLKRAYNNSQAHDTYYVYNNLDLLAFVIPPMANGSVVAADLNKWCYQYHYDAKKRLVEKKLPQKDWEYIVYDKMDRVVMTGPLYNPFGDGSKGWLITKYDAFGRSIYTGYYAGGTFSSAERNSLSLNNFTVESKSAGNTTIDGVTTRYTNTSFPASFKLLSVNYYDDYSFPGAPTSFPTVETQTVNTVLKGQLTGSWARVLTTAASTAGNVSYNLYDNKYRVIRSYAANHLGGYTQVDSQLNFTGTPAKTVTYQKQNSSATVLSFTDVYTYDRRDRLTKQTRQIGTGSIETIAANTYDPLGDLITKNVGGTTGNLQKVDYKYNIRGWLTEINNASMDYVDGENDLFQFAINYNQSAIQNKNLFNGNISSVWVRTKVDNSFKGYVYWYDHLNRLTQAKNMYYHRPGGWLMGQYMDDSYGEAVSYDKNGNILTLDRTGELLDAQQALTIDNLTYAYNGNQLLSVTDNSSPTVNDGFKDGNKVGNDYAYDTFGNITQDKNKGITAISYNHLNLPYQVTFGNGSNIKYTYDAAGTRLKKQVQPSGGALVTTDYVNGFQYENNVLQFFPHAEGYVKRNTNNTYLYVYQYKDHLGNIRLSYADVNANGTIQPASEILEENNYYPFGLKHKGYNEVVNSNRSEVAEKYKFNSKEYQDELGLNVTAMDFRQYDAALGRFYSMDALAEASFSHTPYHYGYNNPVYWNDPTGLLSDSFIGSIWNNSPDGMNTRWENMGDAFVGSYINDIGYALAVFYDGSVEESLPMMYGEATRGGGGHLNLKSFGPYSFGNMVQDHVYRYSQYYQHHRDEMRTRQWDDFQRDLDWFGTIPGIGEPVDFINAGISAIRGDYVAAGLGLGAMIPVGGYAATAIKIQRHHVIPKAVYKEFSGDLKGIIKRDGKANLMPLPEPYHLGGHKAYNNYVTNILSEMRKDGVITPGSINALQGNLRGMINQGLDNFHKTGENLNTYFKQF